MVWKCSNCGKKWHYPVEKCIFCKSDVEKIEKTDFTVKGITQVLVPSLSNPTVPYHVMLLEDTNGNMELSKSMRKYKIGETIGKQKEEKTTIGIVGTGTMSTGIAEMSLKGGMSVILKSRSEEALEKAKKKIENSLLKGMNPEEKEKTIKRLKMTTRYEELNDADIVIESVSEKLEIKKEVFKELEKACSKPILATNTSSFQVGEIASELEDKSRMVGMHFFNPVPRMALVEVIASSETSQDILERTREISRKLGKTPVVLKDTPGFVVNRLLFTIINEAISMLEEGVGTAEEIDKSMRLGANHPIGPLALADLIGLDVCREILNNLDKTLEGERYKTPKLLEEMVKNKELGRKTGKGFYDY